MGEAARRSPRDLGPVEPDDARVRRLKPAEDVDEGRLAGAVGADQAERLAGLEREVDLGEHLQAGESERHALGAQGAFRGAIDRRPAGDRAVRSGWWREGLRGQPADPGQLTRLPAAAQAARHRDHRRQQDQAEADRGEAGRFADRDRAEQAGAVLDAPQQLVHDRDRERPDHRPKDAAGAADDQHRHRRHGRAEVESGGVENAGLVHRQRAADPAQHPADAERDQSLPHHADSDRARRHLVLARSPAGDSRRPTI